MSAHRITKGNLKGEFRKCIGTCGRVLLFTPNNQEIIRKTCSVCEGEGWQKINRRPLRSERWTAADYLRFQKPATVERWIKLDPYLAKQ